MAANPSSGVHNINLLKEVVVLDERSGKEIILQLSSDDYNAVVIHKDQTLLDQLLKQQTSQSGVQSVPAQTNDVVDLPASQEEPSDETCTQQFWTKTDTLKLLDKYRLLIEKVNNGKMKKFRMWTLISNDLDKKFTAEQFRGRWKTITDAYKRTKDKRKKSGNGAVPKYKYEDELDLIMGDNAANINPLTFSSNQEATLSSSSSSDSVEQSEQESTCNNESCEVANYDMAPPVKKVKRTYHSSAQEVITYLKESDEKEERRHKEELEAREKMHSDKMKCLNSLLDILAKKQ